jgi:hypothetical protein
LAILAQVLYPMRAAEEARPRPARVPAA